MLVWIQNLYISQSWMLIVVDLVVWTFNSLMCLMWLESSILSRIGCLLDYEQIWRKSNVVVLAWFQCENQRVILEHFKAQYWRYTTESWKNDTFGDFDDQTRPIQKPDAFGIAAYPRSWGNQLDASDLYLQDLARKTYLYIFTLLFHSYSIQNIF